MKIKTVAIIGAGAIGSYFIAGLTESWEMICGSWQKESAKSVWRKMES